MNGFSFLLSSKRESVLRSRFRTFFENENFSLYQSKSALFALSTSHIGIDKFHIFNDGSAVLVHGTAFIQDGYGSIEPSDVLARLERGDLSFLNEFEGSFACIAYHAPSENYVFWNDQSSTVDAYFWDNASEQIYSTNSVSVAKIAEPGLSPRGTRQFLARGSIMAPDTLFQGIRRLSLGESIARIGRGHAFKQSHWQPQVEPDWENRSKNSCAREIA